MRPVFTFKCPVSSSPFFHCQPISGNFFGHASTVKILFETQVRTNFLIIERLFEKKIILPVCIKIFGRRFGCNSKSKIFSFPWNNFSIWLFAEASIGSWRLLEFSLINGTTHFSKKSGRDIISKALESGRFKRNSFSTRLFWLKF